MRVVLGAILADGPALSELCGLKGHTGFNSVWGSMVSGQPADVVNKREWRGFENPQPVRREEFPSKHPTKIGGQGSFYAGDPNTLLSERCFRDALKGAYDGVFTWEEVGLRFLSPFFGMWRALLPIREIVVPGILHKLAYNLGKEFLRTIFETRTSCSENARQIIVDRLRRFVPHPTMEFNFASLPDMSFSRVKVRKIQQETWCTSSRGTPDMPHLLRRSSMTH